jgi:diguanylate cyclase (GGDEF)-like protein
MQCNKQAFGMDKTASPKTSKIMQLSQHIVLPMVLLLLWALSTFDFLAFHTLIELFTVIVAMAIAFSGWKARQHLTSNRLIFLSVLYFCVGLIDAAHMSTYKGVALIQHINANTPTQFWIFARLIESLGLAVFFNVNTQKKWSFLHYSVFTMIITLLGIVSIYPFNWFPDAYIDGRGLTNFKIYSEFVAVGLVSVAIYGMYRHQHDFLPLQTTYFILSLIFTILAELCFTQYTSVYGDANTLGHLLRLISYLCLFKGFISNDTVSWMAQLKNANPLALTLATLICVIALMATYSIRYFEQTMSAKDQEAANVNQLQDISSSLGIALDAKLQLIDSLKAFVLAQPNFNHQQFTTFAELLTTNQTGIKSLQLAPLGIVSYVSNEPGNSQAIGHNLLQDKIRRPYALKAIQEKKTIIEGPANLIQGGHSLIAREPIFTKMSDNTEQFWGFAIVLIDSDALFSSSVFRQAANRFDISIRKLDGPKQSGDMIFGDSQLFNKTNLITEINFKTQSWQIAIKPKPSIINSQSRFILSPWFWPLVLASTGLAFAASYQIFNYRFHLERAVKVATHSLKKEMSLREQSEANERELATHDILTGLANRRLFVELADIALEEAKQENKSLALLFMDLDGFKAINDAHGHKIGDQILIQVSDRIASSIRQSDVVARYGGDEFIAILKAPGANLVRNAESIISKVADPFHLNEITMKIGISIGIALYPNDGDTLDELISKADHSMYTAKSNGKNGFASYS